MVGEEIAVEVEQNEFLISYKSYRKLGVSDCLAQEILNHNEKRLHFSLQSFKKNSSVIYSDLVASTFLLRPF